MPAYKDKKTGLFYVQFYYRDARGAKRHRTKKGFQTELEALKDDAMDMTFADFCKVYEAEGPRAHLAHQGEHYREQAHPVLRRHAHVRHTARRYRQVAELPHGVHEGGRRRLQAHLPEDHQQPAQPIFNHAERYYGLSDNPGRRVDKIGSKKGGEMQFWTKDEYLRFSEAVMDKPLSFHAFELLYWTGIRCGELLALTPSDFMLESSRLRINKSYQSLNGVDTVTDPKTPKSVRTIVMPAFLRDEMADFIEMRDDVAPDERLFAVTKHFLAHEMERGCKASGVKRIRIHDIRHSHVSLLIEMGFSALAIAERMGHEAVDITYRYAHLFPTKQDEMAAALDGARG